VTERKTFQQSADERRAAEFAAQTMTSRCCMCRWSSGELSSGEAHAAFEAHVASAHPNFEPGEAPRRRAKTRSPRGSRRSQPNGRTQAKTKEKAKA
jgi:hypothetical protein